MTHSPPGWIVSVENPEGDLLYIVATPDPAEAEAIVAETLDIPSDLSVRIVAKATKADLAAFKLERGEIRGPM